MNFRKQFESKSPGFQMAPMIDIVFILLIFFMVATIYAQWEAKIGVTVPTASSGVQTGRTPGEIIINLDSEGTIFVNNVQMKPERLNQLLLQIAQTFKGQPVIIRADQKTNYEYVVRVLDICRNVNVSNISFATLSPENPEEPSQ